MGELCKAMERSYPLKPWWDPSMANLWKPPHRSSLGKEPLTESIYKHVGFYIFFLCACYRDKASTVCELYCRKDTTFHPKHFQIVAGVICRVAGDGGRSWGAQLGQSLFRVMLECCTHSVLGCLWAVLRVSWLTWAPQGWGEPNSAHLPGAASVFAGWGGEANWCMSWGAAVSKRLPWFFCLVFLLWTRLHGDSLAARIEEKWGLVLQTGEVLSHLRHWTCGVPSAKAAFTDSDTNSSSSGALWECSRMGAASPTTPWGSAAFHLQKGAVVLQSWERWEDNILLVQLEGETWTGHVNSSRQS